MLVRLRGPGLLGALIGVLLLGWWAPAAAADGRAGAWRWPLDGAPAVVRPFAPGPTPYSPGHYGADLRGSPGQPVRAVGSGTVSYAGLVAGRGVVVVQHGPLRTTYEPVVAGVRVGEVLPRGAVLGRLAAGHPCAGAACLHWGLRKGEVYLDPVRLVRAGPARLLPLSPHVRQPVVRGSVDPVAAARRLRSSEPVGPAPGGPSSDGARTVVAVGLAAAAGAAGRRARPA